MGKRKLGMIDRDRVPSSVVIDINLSRDRHTRAGRYNCEPAACVNSSNTGGLQIPAGFYWPRQYSAVRYLRRTRCRSQGLEMKPTKISVERERSQILNTRIRRNFAAEC